MTGNVFDRIDRIRLPKGTSGGGEGDPERRQGREGEKEGDLGFRLAAALRSVEETERGTVVTFLASTSAIDRDGESIDPKGWKIPKVLPKVLYGHDWGGYPVGKILSAKKSEDGLVLKIEFADKVPGHEDARIVAGLVRGGFLDQGSVGFRPLRWRDPDGSEHDVEDGEVAGWSVPGRTYLKSELYEFSIVPVPSNVESTVLAIGKAVGMLRISKDESFLDRFLRTAKSLGTSFGEDADGGEEETPSLAPTPSDDSASSPGSIRCPFCCSVGLSELTVVRGLRVALASILARENPDEYRATFDHLAEHLRNAGENVPEFKAREDPFDLEWLALYGVPFSKDVDEEEPGDDLFGPRVGDPPTN